LPASEAGPSGRTKQIENFDELEFGKLYTIYHPFAGTDIDKTSFRIGKFQRFDERGCAEFMNREVPFESRIKISPESNYRIYEGERKRITD
jgi:hypothetical protein